MAAATDCVAAAGVDAGVAAFLDAVALGSFLGFSRVVPALVSVSVTAAVAAVAVVATPGVDLVSSDSAAVDEFALTEAETDDLSEFEGEVAEASESFFPALELDLADVAIFEPVGAEFVDGPAVCDPADSAEPDDADEVESAEACPLPATIATPIPKATANPPTLPTYAPAFMNSIPSARLPRHGLARTERKGRTRTFNRIDDPHSQWQEKYHWYGM